MCQKKITPSAELRILCIELLTTNTNSAVQYLYSQAPELIAQFNEFVQMPTTKGLQNSLQAIPQDRRLVLVEFLSKFLAGDEQSIHDLYCVWKQLANEKLQQKIGDSIAQVQPQLAWRLWEMDEEPLWTPIAETVEVLSAEIGRHEELQTRRKILDATDMVAPELVEQYYYQQLGKSDIDERAQCQQLDNMVFAAQLSCWKNDNPMALETIKKAFMQANIAVQKSPQTIILRRSCALITSIFADFLCFQGKVEEGSRFYEKSLQLLQKIAHLTEHSWKSLRDQAIVLRKLGQVWKGCEQKAQNYYQQSLEIHVALAERTNDSIFCLRNVVDDCKALAQIFYQQQDYSQAYARYQQALATVDKLLSKTYANVLCLRDKATILDNMEELQAQMGQTKQAAQRHERQQIDEQLKQRGQK